MKKLLVVLLAFACAFAVSAQITVGAELSGSVNILKATANNATNPQAGIDTGADDFFAFTLADKDGKFGGSLKYKDIAQSVITTLATATDPLKTVSVAKFDSWSVWYQYDFGKVQIGSSGSGFNGNLNTLIVDKWETDGQGAGLYYTTPALSGLTAQVYFAAPTTAIDAYDVIRTSGASVQYVMENTFKVKALATAGLVADNTKANIYFDFTGVPNLDVYASGQWDQTDADSLAAFGASYTAGALKVIGEFESNWGGDFLWDAALRANYTLNDALSFRLQGKYLANTAALASGDAQIVGQGYVYYTIGNGLSANLMLGYDTVNKFIYQLYAGYKVAF
jgi:hypothetical protein